MPGTKGQILPISLLEWRVLSQIERHQGQSGRDVKVASGVGTATYATLRTLVLKGWIKIDGRAPGERGRASYRYSITEFGARIRGAIERANLEITSVLAIQNLIHLQEEKDGVRQRAE